MDLPTKQGWKKNQGLFPFLVLSVCDDVADVLVVDIASYIWRESVPHVLDLPEREKIMLRSDRIAADDFQCFQLSL